MVICKGARIYCSFFCQRFCAIIFLYYISFAFVEMKKVEVRKIVVCHMTLGKFTAELMISEVRTFGLFIPAGCVFFRPSPECAFMHFMLVFIPVLNMGW